MSSADGELLGTGLHSPGAALRVRLLDGFGPDETFRAFCRRRLEGALALRRELLPPETTGYRLLNAEGDGFAGWTVDRYGDHLVSQITSAGLEALAPEAHGVLAEAFPDGAILQKNDLPARRREGLSREDRVIRGEVPDEVEFLEDGLRLTAELTGGQKTGFYCDQRENRRRVGDLAAGRRVLDLFAHTGAFGLQAARGGAAEIVHVESARRLQERGRCHYVLNGHSADRAEWIEADVFQWLREDGPTHDLVICDPPPLVRRKSALTKGARAYKDLNRLALGRVAPGGLYLTFTCSSAVDGKLFRQILFSAAQEAGVSLSLLAPLGAALDHPVAVTHPEGEYLKGWLAVVRHDGR